MTTQFKPKTGGRGTEWCDETRNPTGGCHRDRMSGMFAPKVPADHVRQTLSPMRAARLVPEAFTRVNLEVLS